METNTKRSPSFCSPNVKQADHLPLHSTHVLRLIKTSSGSYLRRLTDWVVLWTLALSGLYSTTHSGAPCSSFSGNSGGVCRGILLRETHLSPPRTGKEPEAGHKARTMHLPTRSALLQGLGDSDRKKFVTPLGRVCP